MKKQTKESLYYIEEAMSLIPANTATAMLVRHADRPDIPKGQHGNDILLTPQGEKNSFAAGELMKGRIANFLHSPVERCQQTAKLMRDGSGSSAALEVWVGLRCDAYVENLKLASGTLGCLSGDDDDFYDGFIQRMSESGLKSPYPHFKPPLIGARDLIRHLLLCSNSGVCVGVTHDWLVNVAVSYATGEVITRRDFAQYLDALFVWKDGGRWKFYYKGRSGECPEELCKILAS